MQQIIKKWGNPSSENNYIFPILSPGLNELNVREGFENFTVLINKELKNIAADVGIEKNLTTYVARHSFATVLKRSGSSIQLISETLGHSDLKTTQKLSRRI
jgi:integrase